MSTSNVHFKAVVEGLGFERVDGIPGSTYRDNSTVIVVPGRDEMVHQRIAQSWMNIVAPMNQKRAFLFCHGDEVGHAYDRMIQNILDNPDLRNWKYVLSLETDNLIPPDAQIRLLETIESGPKYDVVAGLYFTKGDYNMPMAYGSPAEYEATGQLDFRPRDVREALAAGQVMPVNGVAMGCTLWRLELFRQFPKPWFVTVNDVIPNQGVMAMTQDLYFCRRLREAGKKLAVDLRVRVGHMDLTTGIVY